MTTSDKEGGAANSTPALPEYEVEQKFTLQSIEETETRLRELGFEKTPKDIHMVDWYWDVNDGVCGSDCRWELTTQDCWLRLRQVTNKSTGWQLKVRRQLAADGSASAAATVYEEIGGSEALSKAISMLSPLPSSSNDSKGMEIQSSSESESEGQKLLNQFVTETKVDIPEEIQNGSSDTTTLLILPFARIETKRSSWIPSSTIQGESELHNLKVDLDVAIYDSPSSSPDDAIHAVGEVEEVVHKEEEIVLAKKRVEDFIHQLTAIATDDDDDDDNSSSQVERAVALLPPEGKLEYYLMQHRPDHYQALVENGILK